MVKGGLNSAAGVSAGDILAGNYRVERVLAVGGMRVVVAARDIQLEERVAIKFLLPSALGNSDAIARFAREATAAANIHSEHVARVLDTGTLPNGAPYMVMEYLEGPVLPRAPGRALAPATPRASKDSLPPVGGSTGAPASRKTALVEAGLTGALAVLGIVGSVLLLTRAKVAHGLPEIAAGRAPTAALAPPPPAMDQASDTSLWNVVPTVVALAPTPAASAPEAIAKTAAILRKRTPSSTLPGVVAYGPLLPLTSAMLLDGGDGESPVLLRSPQTRLGLQLEREDPWLEAARR